MIGEIIKVAGENWIKERECVRGKKRATYKDTKVGMRGYVKNGDGMERKEK